MKKQTYALILALLVFFVVNPTFATESPPNARPPDIQFEEITYDFGVAGQNEEVIHEFRFKNVGGKTLSIKGIRSSCGCIAKSVSRDTIPPGESGVITVVFETRKYHGRHTKSVFVETNDPDEPEVELSISGMIKTEVAVVPQFVFFGDVEKGNRITKEINLIQIGDEKLRLEKAEPSSKYLTARISRLMDDRNQGFTISVSLGTDMPVGKFAEVITLYTNLKKHRKIDVPVAGNILYKNSH